MSTDRPTLDGPSRITFLKPPIENYVRECGKLDPLADPVCTWKEYLQVSECQAPLSWTQCHSTCHPCDETCETRSVEASGCYCPYGFEFKDGKCEAIQCVTGWSDCTKSCGGGETVREVFNDGGFVTQTRRCNEQSCPIETDDQSECAPCDDGHWVCESTLCSNGKSCQMINLLGDFKCMPNILGECKAWGDPHVVTFDGASNDVYGIGNYTFIELNYTGKETSRIFVD